MLRFRISVFESKGKVAVRFGLGSVCSIINVSSTNFLNQFQDLLHSRSHHRNLNKNERGELHFDDFYCFLRRFSLENRYVSERRFACYKAYVDSNLCMSVFLCSFMLIYSFVW
jgi:hypothetical protein